MKILVTLDFPPQHGGIPRYLEGIVHHTFTTGDLVIAGVHPPADPVPLSCGARVRYARMPLMGEVHARFHSIVHFFLLLKLCLQRPSRNLEIWCGNVSAALPAFLLGYVLRQPYAVYTYGTELLKLKGPRRWLTRMVLQRAQKIAVLGAFTESLVTCLVPGRRHLIRVPPRLSLDPARVRAGVERKELRTPARSRLRLLCVGRFVYHKGQHVLIEALKRLSPDIWQCRFVGNGPRLAVCRKTCDLYGISKGVVFLEEISDENREAEYACADILVVPSLMGDTGVEGFGIVILEAFAKGVPVIASRSGGIPEVLAKCGVGVPENDPTALARAIDALWKDPERRMSLVRAGAERVCRHYAW